jgi:hypothetical protein
VLAAISGGFRSLLIARGEQRIGVSILSYDGQLVFGLTGDYATTPDLAVLRRGIEAGVAELLAAAAACDPGTTAGSSGDEPR